MVVWQSDALSVAGLALEVCVGAAYVTGARRSSRRRGWPAARTGLFIAGLLSLSVVLQSGIAAYDETYAVHLVQHVVLMCIAPLLLALGAPVTLLLSATPPRVARRVVAALHSRPSRFVCGRRAAWHVPLEYYGLMFVFLLAPVQRLTERSSLAHVSSHVLLLTCGLLFWVPIVGRDPAPWRPSDRTRLFAVAAGVPVNAALALAAGSWELLVVSTAAAMCGLAVVRMRPTRTPGQRRSEPAQPIAVAAVRV